jgi:hypothetical protein
MHVADGAFRHRAEADTRLFQVFVCRGTWYLPDVLTGYLRVPPRPKF